MLGNLSKAIEHDALDLAFANGIKQRDREEQDVETPRECLSVAAALLPGDQVPRETTDNYIGCRRLRGGGSHVWQPWMTYRSQGDFCKAVGDVGDSGYNPLFYCNPHGSAVDQNHSQNLVITQGMEDRAGKGRAYGNLIYCTILLNEQVMAVA